MKAQRNKTIDYSVKQLSEHLSRCITLKGKVSVEDVTDKTIIGDTFSTLKYLPDNFIDLLIVDPPYNLDKQFGKSKFSKMSQEDYADYTEKWLKAVLPKLKESASVYVCCDWKSAIVIAPVLQKYLDIKNRITWQREKGRGAKSNWKNGMEDIFFCTKSSEFTFNVNAVKVRRKVNAPYTENGLPKDWEYTKNGKYRDTYPSNFWDDISIPYWSMPENTSHPTQKPEKLLAKIILASSNEGDFIFDPFAGSGSTLVTAKKLGRHYLGIEKNEQYCAWTEYRLNKAESDKTIQGFSDGVFWERNTKPTKTK